LSEWALLWFRPASFPENVVRRREEWIVSMKPLAYPAARVSDQIDVYHGITVADPYRWLEDPDTPEARSWIEAENALTFGYLDEIPERATLRERLTSLWNYERFGLPFQEGGRYFFHHNSGLQSQAVLYVAESLEAEPRVLLDPNLLSTDGTIALTGMAVDNSGRYMAYGLATAGSDWNEWRIRNVVTGEDKEDLLRWVKFSSVAWTADSRGFFYSRYDAPEPGAALLQDVNQGHKVYFHRLGDDQSLDRLVYERPDHKDWIIRTTVTDDGDYLLLSAVQGTERRSRIFLLDLAKPDPAVQDLLPEGDAAYSFVGNDGPLFYFVTDKGAANSRVILIDVRHPAPSEWREIVAEAGDALQSARLFGDRLIVSYLKDAHSAIRIYERHRGEFVEDLSLPGLGTVSGFWGRQSDTETFFGFTSYTVPTTIYRYELDSGRISLFRQPAVAFDRDAYETRQLFCRSKDGTRIPLFVTLRKDAVLDGTNPTLLYGYGGFDVSLTPAFSPTVALWLMMGGVYAVANLRGGGEYGEAWHDAGKKLRRQNVFDDFIAVAEHLQAGGYTCPERLAINGGSNGGLLVGACMEQRPDLFGAAIPEVGVLDMLRFPQFTIGWAWQSDYGSPDDPAEFRALLAYSPYHNLKAGVRYPATLVMTSDHDDRVVPAHSFKFAAALQAAQAPDGPPVLIRVEVRAGHGAGKPIQKVIEEYADKYAFLVRNLGIAVALP